MLILAFILDVPHQPAVYAIVGRLWCYVAEFRVQNFHGEDHVRLDRTIRVLEHEEERPPFFLRLVSVLLLFGHPENVRLRLDEQLVDGLTYQVIPPHAGPPLVSDGRSAGYERAMGGKIRRFYGQQIIGVAFVGRHTPRLGMFNLLRLPIRGWAAAAYSALAF